METNKRACYFRNAERSKYILIRVISEEEIERINTTRMLPEKLTLVYFEPNVKSPYAKYTNYYLVNKLPFTQAPSRLPDGYKLERKFNSKTAPIVLVKI